MYYVTYEQCRAVTQSLLLLLKSDITPLWIVIVEIERAGQSNWDRCFRRVPWRVTQRLHLIGGVHSPSSKCFGRLTKQGISAVGSSYHPSFRELFFITFVLTNFYQWACCSLTYFLVFSNLPIPLQIVL